MTTFGYTTYPSSRPAFVADEESLARAPGCQIDWAAVPDSYRNSAFSVTLDGAASATDTSLTVDALEGDVPAGTLLFFGQTGEYARVTADAAAGDTELTVEALPADLENGDAATIGGAGGKVIPAGTVMARLSSGLHIPRAAVAGAETATGLLATDAAESDRSASLTGYGLFIGGAVYENLLPEAVANVISSTYKTELQTAGVGTGFAFLTYSDSRAS